ncbi:MAG: hypothetical protein FWG72_00730 [Oscillospiraceae bacterium]|nr:hypothetical protein [Oscillospiraceae bacterium]
MKNKQFIDAWNKIAPDSAADARMLDAILARNQAMRQTKKGEVYTMIQKFNRKWLAAAACLIVVAAVAIPLLNGGGEFDLARSAGVKVRPAANPPGGTVFSLAYLTEAELFAPEWRGMEIAAFEGLVQEVENIVIDYNGEKDYRAIVSIEVVEVFRGSVEAGSVVRVLLPAPVGGDVRRTDTSVSSQMTVGTRGIFMPMKYNETTYSEQNGGTLFLLDIAEYGLGDGERWAFLDKPDGPVFARYAYEGAADAADMDDIRRYVADMLAD